MARATAAALAIIALVLIAGAAGWIAGRAQRAAVTPGPGPAGAASASPPLPGAAAAAEPATMALARIPLAPEASWYRPLVHPGQWQGSDSVNPDLEFLGRLRYRLPYRTGLSLRPVTATGATQAAPNPFRGVFNGRFGTLPAKFQLWSEQDGRRLVHLLVPWTAEASTIWRDHVWQRGADLEIDVPARIGNRIPYRIQRSAGLIEIQVRSQAPGSGMYSTVLECRADPGDGVAMQAMLELALGMAFELAP